MPLSSFRSSMSVIRCRHRRGRRSVSSLGDMSVSGLSALASLAPLFWGNSIRLQGDRAACTVLRARTQQGACLQTIQAQQ